MNERNRYKILPLPSPYKWDLSEEYIDDILNTGDIKIEPVFGRDGWYYDRLNDTSWIESKYGCFENRNSGMFKYEMTRLSHNILPTKVLAAIKVLKHYNMCPKNLLKVLWKDEEVKHLIDIGRSAYRYRHRFEKEYALKEEESETPRN